jgi:hypothetical protein
MNGIDEGESPSKRTWNACVCSVAGAAIVPAKVRRVDGPWNKYLTAIVKCWKFESTADDITQEDQDVCAIKIHAVTIACS